MPTFIIGNCEVIPLKEYIMFYPHSIEKSSLPKLKRIMTNFSVGNKVDFRSFFDVLINRLVLGDNNAHPRSGSLALVDHLLSESDLYANNSLFRDFEDGQREKVGPYSIRLPFTEVVLRGPCEYYAPFDSPVSFDKSIFEEAVLSVKRLIPPSSLRRLTLTEALNRSEKTTQWGLPYLLKGNDLVNGTQACNLYYNIALSDLQRGKVTWFPNVMFMRTQPSGTDIPKQRIAFGVPHSIILLESTVQIPALEALKYFPQFCENLSSSSTDLYATALFKECKDSGNNIIGFDASGYDKTISSDLIRAAYSCLSSWFSESDSWLINELCEFMIKSDLVTPIGVFTGRSKGVASGSALTNMVDSLCQYILHEYTRIKLNVTHCPIPTFQGDDGVWAIPGLNQHLLSQIMSEFNIIVNPDKVSCSPFYFTYCQRLYLHDYSVNGINVGIRSAFRVINSIVSYERRRKEGWTGAHDSVRVLSQLIGLENNPIHFNLTLKLIEADTKYGLGTRCQAGLRGLFVEVGGFNSMVELAGISSWDRDKLFTISKRLYQFETVKIIQSILLDKPLQ